MKSKNSRSSGALSIAGLKTGHSCCSSVREAYWRYRDLGSWQILKGLIASGETPEGRPPPCREVYPPWQLLAVQSV